MSTITTYTPLTAPQVTGVNTGITTIKTNIAGLTRVAPGEKDSLNNISNERLPFVERSVNNHIVNYAALMPPGFNSGMVTGHLQLYQQLVNAKNNIADINETLDDAISLVGDQLFFFLRKLYDNAQLNMEVNTAGAQVVYDDLKELFGRQGPSSGGNTAGDGNGGGTPT